MDNLQADLDQLEDTRLDYVMERSRVNSDADAYRNCGISKSTFYSWPEREKLNEIAQKLKRQCALRARMILQEAVEEAAQVKVDGLKYMDKRLKQSVATEIIDRVNGKPTQRSEVKAEVDGTIELVWPDALTIGANEDNTSETA